METEPQAVLSAPSAGAMTAYYNLLPSCNAVTFHLGQGQWELRHSFIPGQTFAELLWELLWANQMQGGP